MICKACCNKDHKSCTGDCPCRHKSKWNFEVKKNGDKESKDNNGDRS